METTLKKGLKFLVYGVVLAVSAILAFFAYQNKRDVATGLNFISTAHADVPNTSNDVGNDVGNDVSVSVGSDDDDDDDDGG